MSVKKTLFRLLVISLIILTAFTGCMLQYKAALQRAVEDATLMLLSEITDQFSYSFISRQKSEAALLQSIASAVEEFGAYNAILDDATTVEEAPLLLDRIFVYLQKIIGDTSFDYLCIVNDQGKGRTQDNTEFDVSDLDFFKRSMQGETVMTDPRSSLMRGDRVIVVSTPMHSNRTGKVKGVLMASYQTESLDQLFSTSAFDGLGYAYAVNPMGDLIARTTSDFPPANYENVFDTYKKCEFEESTALENIKADMAAGLSGNISYTVEEGLRFLQYRPLGINDWYLFSVVPEEVITEQTDKILLYSNIFIFLISIAFAALLGYTYLCQKRSMKKLKENMDRFDIMAEQVQSVVFEFDIRTGRVTHSDHFQKLFGLDPVLENFPSSVVKEKFIHKDDEAVFLALYDRLIGGENYVAAELRIRTVNNSYIWCVVSIAAILDDNGTPIKGIGQISDALYTDRVTGACNRRKFESDATKLLSKTKEPYAFVHLDVDKFKIFNDTFGYEGGDALLCHIANVLETHLEENEFFSRDTSDQFTLLVKVPSAEALTARLEKMATDIALFSEKNGLPYRIIICMGIYLIGHETLPLAVIGDRAKLAHTQTKGTSTSQIAFFDNSLRDQALMEKAIENRMEQAMDAEEFLIYLQPKYLLATEQMVGCEALVRWKTADGQFMYPSSFIPIFEKNGFIHKLDTYMFRKACQTIRGWMDKGMEPVPISVNFSKLYLMDRHFVQEITHIAKQYSVPTRYLEIEVTESTIIDNLHLLESIIQKLHAEGFLFSMDDFGSGYSSLGMLKNLHFDIIKLDRSFFTTDMERARTKIVVGSVISMAKQLGITTVAEGVETQENIDFLREMGCDIVQGYYYARPMEAELMQGLL